MGAVANLSSSTVSVDPGRTAVLTVTVRNTGSVVDRFSFDTVGAAAPWVTYSPETLSLFPEAAGTVNVTFAPPRASTVLAGPTPFGVRIVSNEDAAGSVVEEGTVEVAGFSDIQAELMPRVTRGRRVARAQLAIDNRSNCPYRASLAGSDPAAALAIAISPATVDIPPGAAAFSKVRLKPRRTFWRGMTTTRPYSLILTSPPAVGAGPQSNDGAAPAGATIATAEGTVVTADAPVATAVPAPSVHKPEIIADGTIAQEPLLPAWTLRALAALIALGALLAILWFALLKPQVKSTAQDEVQHQLASAGLVSNSPTGSSSGSAKPSGGSGGGTGAGSGGGSGAGSGAGGTSVTSVQSSGAGTSGGSAGITINGSKQASGNGTSTVFVVPNGRVLQVTDLLVENSAGDSGNLALARNGVILMQWSLANFRDLDYHWIAPTVFGSGTKVQMIVSGCSNACTPGIYYAGNLASST